MNSEPIIQHINYFQRRFGKIHLYFAYHAAFPLSLTPDLSYRLWINFQRDSTGNTLRNDRGKLLRSSGWSAVIQSLLRSGARALRNGAEYSQRITEKTAQG